MEQKIRIKGNILIVGVGNSGTCIVNQMISSGIIGSSKFFANLGLNIEGLYSFHCGIVRRNVRVCFLICFLFFFFFRKDSEK